MIKLSILIPSLETRRVGLSELVCSLFVQCGMLTGVKPETQKDCSIVTLFFKEVEIIICVDQKQLTTGSKRNLLLDLSCGEYIVYCDCDDEVYPYYVEEILKASKYDTDCIGTIGYITTNGENKIEWRLSKDYPNATIYEKEGDINKSVYLRTTNHISPVKRSLALLAGFPDISLAEDKEYSIRLNPHLKTEVKIDKPLYLYKYSTFNKEY